MQKKVFSEAILVGILTIPKFKLAIRPFSDPATERVAFEVTGDIDAALDKIYANAPVGALDALQGIKAVRSMIFTVGRRNGHSKD